MIKIKNTRAIIFLFSTLLLFNQAFALGFTPVAGDVVKQITDAIFGALDGMNVDAFSGMMGEWNSSVLMIGGMLAAYLIFTGTLSSAHSADFFGKVMDPMWLPIRYPIFTASILPMVKGYCLMQVIVYWFLMQGIGLADNLWLAYLKDSNLQQTSSAGIIRPVSKELAYKMFESLTCMEVISHVYDDAPVLDQLKQSSFGTTKVKGVTSTTYYMGDKNEINGMSKGICGTFTLSDTDTPALQTSNNPINFMKNFSDAAQRAANIHAKHEVELVKMISALEPLAQKAAQLQYVSPDQIEKIATTYDEDMRMAAASEVAKMDTFKDLNENAGKSGFGLAGAFFVPLAFMNDMIQRSVSDVPTASGPVDMSNKLMRDKWVSVHSKLQDTLAAADRVASVRIGFGTDDQAGANNSWSSTIWKTISSGMDLTKIVDKIFSDTASFVLVDGENPVMALIRMGKWLLAIAGTAWAGLTALLVTVGNAPGIGGAICVAIMMFVTPIMVTGFLLAYVLPLIPFMIWIGSLMALLNMIIQSLVVSPLWAVMHLYHGGSGIAGTATQGYKLALSLVVRPPLMVFGFVASLVVIQVLGGVLNQVFAGVFLLTQVDSGLFIKIFGCLVAAPLMYGTMMYTIIKKGFDITHQMPDDVLNWFGGGGPMLGKHAEDVGGDRSHTVVAAGAVSRTTGQSAESMLNKRFNGNNNDVGGNGKPSGRERSDDVRSAAMGALKSQYGRSGEGGSFQDMQNKKNEADLATQQNELGDQLGNIENSLGGVDSPENQSFLNDFEKRQQENPDMPVMEAANSSYKKALNHKFGRGSGVLLGAISGGSMNGDKFNQTFQSYQDASNRLSDAGFKPREIKDKIYGANVAAKTDFKNSQDSVENGGDKNLDFFVQDRLSSLRE
ncbi:DotA/TraY family protein (plasmid) [Burkholderia vietnamiensis]